VGEGDSSAGLLFFFGDADGEASVVAVFFLVVVDAEVLAAPAFFVVEVFFAVVADAWVVVVACSSLCAQETTSAPATKTAVKQRVNFLIVL
jgi:hypothetical protein